MPVPFDGATKIAYPLSERKQLKRTPLSRGGAVGRVEGLVLSVDSVGLVVGPVDSVVKGAEQIRAARL